MLMGNMAFACPLKFRVGINRSAGELFAIAADSGKVFWDLLQQMLSLLIAELETVDLILSFFGFPTGSPLFWTERDGLL